MSNPDPNIGPGDYFTMDGIFGNDEHVFTMGLYQPSFDNIVTTVRKSFVSEPLDNLVEVLDPVRVPTDSIYKTTKVFDDGESRFFGNLPLYEIIEHPDDIYHEVQPDEEHRLELISYRRYQLNPRLWPLIALASELRWSILFLKSGTVLRLPDLDRIFSEILT